MRRTKNTLKNLTLLVIITACCFLFTGCKKDLGSYKYPNANVILILIDTLRSDHLGCYGYHRETSPEIDKLAQESIVFKNMLAQTSWTRPGTASILTGLYPKNHGANTREDRLAEEVNLLSEILSRVGYTSYAVVANGNAGKNVGFNQGYKEFFTCRESVEKDPVNIHVRSDDVNKVVFNVIRKLEKPAKNFVYVHYVDPHEPYIPKEKHFSKNNKGVYTLDFFRSGEMHKLSKAEQQIKIEEMINAYDDEVLFNDKMVGNLIRVLKEEKIYDNSIIIVTSDHGEEFFEHGGLSHGRTLYDDQLKVPFVLRLPDNIRKEMLKIANQVDICPTILSLLNIPIPKTIDGIDLLNDKIPLRQHSFAELDIDERLINSIQSTSGKLIERMVSPPVDKQKSRWFTRRATIETSEDSLELIVSTFYKPGSVQVLSDGKPVKKLKITPMKQVFDVVLPKSNTKKTVTIKSLFPCRVPKKMGLNNDSRCLSFRIFDSKNINDGSILGEFFEEYYVLPQDPGEKKNLIRRKRFAGSIIELRKNLLKYKYDKRNLLFKKKPVIFDEEQLKTLEALGYI